MGGQYESYSVGHKQQGRRDHTQVIPSGRFQHDSAAVDIALNA